MLETHCNHCSTLQWDYNKFQMIDFETVPLTEAQWEFKVSRNFTLEDVTYIVGGLYWNDKHMDYDTVYCIIAKTLPFHHLHICRTKELYIKISRLILTILGGLKIDKTLLLQE